MKSSIKRGSRSVMAVALALCMLVSCMTVGIIATDAARTMSDNVGSHNYNDGDFRLVGSINSWSNSTNYVSGTLVTSGENANVAHYADYYLYGSSDNSEVYYKFYEADNKYVRFCPNSGSNTEVTGSWKEAKEGDDGAFYINRKGLGTDSSTLYRVRIYLKHNNDMGTWFEKSTVADMSPAITTKKGSDTTTEFTVGDTVSLSATASNNVGTVSYAYEYKLSTDTEYQSVSGTSFTPSAAGTYDIKVTATDGGVVKNKNAQKARTETATTQITVASAETSHNVTVNIVGHGTVTANGTAVANGGTISVGESTATEIVAAPDEHNHFVNWTVNNVALGSGTTTTASDTITASADGSITANFAESQQYSITATGCTASPSGQAYEGETVTLTPSVPQGKTVDTVSVLDESSQPVPYQLSGDKYTFVMPGSAVTATITYRDPVTINVSATSADSAKGSASASPSGSVTEGTPIQFSASPSANYTFDKWIVTENGTPRTVNEPTFVQIAGRYDISAVAYFNDGYSVAVGIDEGGQVEGVSHEYAVAGDTITVTYNTKFGYTFDKLIDNNNSGATVTPASQDSTTITFTMPASSVDYTIKLKSTITTSANWKYFGYKKSDEKLKALSGYDGNAFSESYLDGDTSKNFAFYKVSGRTDDDGQQAFGVRNTSANADVNTIFLEIPSGWTNAYYARFYKGSGSSPLNQKGEVVSTSSNDSYLQMIDTQYDVNGHDVYAVVVPPTATVVQFCDNNHTNRSDELTLSISNNYFYKSSSWGKSTNSNFPSNTGGMYLWKNYKDHDSKNVYGNKQFGSNLTITNHNFTYYLADGHNGTDLTVPKVYLPEEVRGMDYYIIVYYPGKYYGEINGVKVDTRDLDHPVIVAQTFLPGEKVDPIVVTNVKVIAKDGAVRRYGASRNPGSDQDYSTFEKYADTVLTNDTYVGDPDYSHERKGYCTSDKTYDYAAKVEKGSTIYFKTTVNSANRNKFYVKAFSINGVVYALNEPDISTGVYKGSFTIPTDYDRNYVEITPIYYYVNSGDTVRFSVQGYDDSVMNSGWGNTLYVYPYWEGVKKANNGFGGYPGQPMIFYKGEYYIDIPVTFSGKTVKGMTLNNGYWDDIHYKVVGEVSKHHQTYDYDDFYKIYKEYPDPGNGVTRRIICSYKFRTKKDNDEPNTIDPANYNSTNGNGWEVLTNYEGKPVDIFGKELDKTVADVEALDSVVHVVSQDYKQNCAGHYATEWAIYNTSNSKVSRIVPSALVINENNIRNSRSALTVSQVKTYMDDVYGPSTAEFADEYVALDVLRGQPAMITYEKSIWGGNDPAERCDARWYWSYTDTRVNANIRVAYSNDGGTTFNLDGTDPLADNAVPPVTGALVSFGDEKTAKSHVLTNQEIDTPISLSGDLTTTNGYSFVGWYAIREGVAQYVGTDPSQSDIPLTSNVTFEARYVRTANGFFTVGHLVHPASTGTGTVEISAQLKVDGNPSGNVKTATNGFVEFSELSYGKKQTIDVTLSSTPTGLSTFDDFYATLADLLSGYNADYISNLVINKTATTSTATFTVTVDKLFKVKDQSDITQVVTSMTNYSKFDIDDVELDVNIVFTFPVRYYPNKNYEYKHVTITKAEILKYFPDVDSITVLTPEYVMSKAPFESIYRNTFTWDPPVINGLNATVAGTAEEDEFVFAVVDNGSGSTEKYKAKHFTNFEEYCKTEITHVNKESENLYFQYWNIYKLEDQYMDNKVPVAKCFSLNFNYAGFEDYYVEAVYDTTPVENRQALVTGLTNNASLLDITRSHWNNTLTGTDDNGILYNKADKEYDRIYVDFVLSWANGGKLVNAETNKTFGYNLKYVDGDVSKTIPYTINDLSKVDEKNRIEVALGIENLVGNASPTRSYTIVPTVDGVEIGTASQAFCLYDVALPLAKWAR